MCSAVCCLQFAVRSPFLVWFCLSTPPLQLQNVIHDHTSTTMGSCLFDYVSHVSLTTYGRRRHHPGFTADSVLAGLFHRPRPNEAEELMAHMASMGAFSGRAGSGYWISPELESTELDTLMTNNLVTGIVLFGFAFVTTRVK